MSTTIQWTDVTDNIIRVKGGGWWCRMISPGCVNCYAAKLNQSSFFGGNKLPYTGEPPELYLDTELIASWSRQRKRKLHFVASMTDIFGDWVINGWQYEFLSAMANAPLQTFQLLTKRPEIAATVINSWLRWKGLNQLPDNIWIGTSVENQEWANRRIPELLKIPAKVRFLSVEPLLEPVDLKRAVPCGYYCSEDVGHVDHSLSGIHWVIVGGESGDKARHCHVEWIRSIIHQCVAADVPVFAKQLGSKSFWTGFGSDGEGEGILRLKDRKGGDMTEWPEDLRVREFPKI